MFVHLVYQRVEHIEDDRTVLMEMHRALKKGGIVLLTVPQHAWLWSSVDEYSCHVRRYSADEIHKKLQDAGFSILRSTSFVAILLPVMMLSRMAKRRGSNDIGSTAELNVPTIINKLSYILMKIECIFIKFGGSIPFGGSRLVVARKSTE